MSNFAGRLRNLRRTKKISQVSLAEEVGVSQRVISYYEADKDIPSLNILIFLADYFDVSLDYLVGRSDDPTWR